MDCLIRPYRPKPRSVIFPDDWAVIRMLVAACLRHALRDGAPAVGLHTSSIMATALRLYSTHGFTRDRELDSIDGVSCGRYVLPAERLQQAPDRLASWPA